MTMYIEITKFGLNGKVFYWHQPTVAKPYNILYIKKMENLQVNNLKQKIFYVVFVCSCIVMIFWTVQIFITWLFLFSSKTHQFDLVTNSNHHRNTIWVSHLLIVQSYQMYCAWSGIFTHDRADEICNYKEAWVRVAQILSLLRQQDPLWVLF
jgi:hypothetical protein